MMMIEAHTNHRTRTVMTAGPNQDRQINTGKETYMMLRIEEIGMTAMPAGQIIVIILS